jgi:hypothetical protein
MLFKTFLCSLLIVLSVTIVFGIKQVNRFRPAKCLIEWPSMPEWETEPLSDPAILSQLEKTFTYFARGNQSYVFLSHDGKFVLKLFSYNTCPIPYGQICERFLRKHIGLKKKRFLPLETRILKNFTACQLAYNLARKQTGVLFVHLNPKKGILPTIKVKDRLGRTHEIDPARYRFVLQEKAKPLIENLNAQTIQKFYKLTQELSELGIVNLDPKIGSNFGCLDGRVVQVDFGNFSYCPERAAANQVAFEKKFTEWLNKKSTQEHSF